MGRRCGKQGRRASGYGNRVINCLKGIWIPLASLLFWILQFYQVSDSPVYELQSFGAAQLLHELRNYAYTILIRVTGWNQTACTCFFFAVLVMMLVVTFCIRNIGPMLVILFSFLFQCVFSVMVYQLHIWHYITLAFVFLWMLWSMEATAANIPKSVRTTQEEGSALVKNSQTDAHSECNIYFCKTNFRKNSSWKYKLYRTSFSALQILLGILAIAMFLHWNSDEETSNLYQALHGSYSDGENAAEFIQENISTDDILISTDVALDSTILAYLDDYRCYYAGSGKITSYADWSEEQSRIISLEELLAWCRESFPAEECVYLIQGSTSCITDGESLEQYEAIYETEGTTTRGEEYTIYKITLY